MYTRASAVRPQVQLLAVVAVAGLPTPVTSHRCDSLWGTARTPIGHHFYPLPERSDPLPPDLLAEAAGPILDFLLAAARLSEFVLWAQDIFAGQQHRGWWGRFQPVMPQGTGPLNAAAFAAALLPDPRLVEFLTARVENEEPDEHRLDDYLAEIRQFYPHLRHRHPITRPARS